MKPLARLSLPRSPFERDSVVPVRDNRVREIRTDEALFLRPPAPAEALQLNWTSQMIWEACDGRSNVGEIIRQLATRVGSEQARLRDDVVEGMSTLRKLDVLHVAPAEPCTVHIVHQAKSDIRGLFALYHYVSAMLHCIDEKHRKRVTILDGDEDYWNALFEAPPQSEPQSQLERTEEVRVPLIRFNKFLATYPDLIRRDCDLEVLTHQIFRGFPAGGEVSRKLGDRDLRRRMHRAAEKSCRPRARWVAAAEALHGTTAPRVYNIGLHLRSTHHLGVEIEAEQYIDEVAFEEVQRLVRAKGIGDYRIFVATHVGEYLEHCKKRFGDRLISTEIEREPDPATDFRHLDATLFEKGRDVLLDSLLLSRCDFLFGTPSNVLIAALIFNPECDFKIFDFALERRESHAFFPARKS